MKDTKLFTPSKDSKLKKNENWEYKWILVAVISMFHNIFTIVRRIVAEKFYQERVILKFNSFSYFEFFQLKPKNFPKKEVASKKIQILSKYFFFS